MKLLNFFAAGVLSKLFLLTAPAYGATLCIHYPTANKDTISLNVNDSRRSMEQQRRGQRCTHFNEPFARIKVRAILNDKIPSQQGSITVGAGQHIDLFPHFYHTVGRIKIIKDLYSPQLHNKRNLRIYFPPSYEENTLKHYPVVYMHDAQNLFEKATSSFGNEWEIDEHMDALIVDGKIREAIIVGIDNNADRINELTPCCDPKYGGGKLNLYEDFIIDTVKPFIDQNFRTKPDRANTYLMGSSLGGLASFYIADRHPELFSKAASLSGSFWWNKNAITQHIGGNNKKFPIRFYLDTGTPDDASAESVLMRDALIKKGFILNKNLIYLEIPGAQHNEQSWAARVATPIQFLLGMDPRD